MEYGHPEVHETQQGCRGDNYALSTYYMLSSALGCLHWGCEWKQHCGPGQERAHVDLGVQGDPGRNGSKGIGSAHAEFTVNPILRSHRNTFSSRGFVFPILQKETMSQRTSRAS